MSDQPQTEQKKISANFKPSAEKRQIRFATKEQVERVGAKIDKEFTGVYKILADK